MDQYSGYPVLLYCKKTWKILKYGVENQENTDNASMVGHAYVKLYSFSVFIYLKYVLHQKSTSATATKHEKYLEFISTQIKKPGHWMQQQSHCRLTVKIV